MTQDHKYLNDVYKTILHCLATFNFTLDQTIPLLPIFLKINVELEAMNKDPLFTSNEKSKNMDHFLSIMNKKAVELSKLPEMEGIDLQTILLILQSLWVRVLLNRC